jgi:stage III sporulation protein SpoIIIAA
MKVMEILKSKLESLLKELPEKVDVEDVIYRLYLLQKIEAGEKDVAEGRTLSHKDAIERLSKKWQN